MKRYRIPIVGHRDEKVMFLTRRHLMSMFSVSLLIIFLFLIPIVFFILIFRGYPGFVASQAFNFALIIASIYYLVMITYAFINWINYYYNVCIITDRFIIDINQQGIFNRFITEINLISVQDVSANIKGFLPTVFGYGDVIAETAGENTKSYILENVPNPVELANRILTLHHERICQEGNEGMTAESRQVRYEKSSFWHQNHQAQGAPMPKPVETSPVYIPPVVHEPKNNPPEKIESIKSNLPLEEGKLSTEDLNKGGEIKF